MCVCVGGGGRVFFVGFMVCARDSRHLHLHAQAIGATSGGATPMILLGRAKVTGIEARCEMRTNAAVSEATGDPPHLNADRVSLAEILIGVAIQEACGVVIAAAGIPATARLLAGGPTCETSLPIAKNERSLCTT